MTILVNNFSGGTDTAAITTGNSGGVSGNPFDIINAAFGGTATYSSAQAHVSTLSGLMTMSASATAAVAWSASLTASTVPQVWFRLYCLIPAYAAFNNYLWDCVPAAGFGSDLVVGSSGTLLFQDANGTTQLASTVVVPLGSWIRVEGYVIGSTTAGQMEMKIFLIPDATVPAETDTSGTAVNTGGPIASVSYGISNQGGAGGAFTEYLDGLGVSTTGYLGPWPAPSAPVQPAVYSMRTFP